MSLGIIRSRSLNSQVVDVLGQRIISGSYSEGEQLPIESELCTELGVSRPVLREATKALVSKGLLRIRPRVGTTVQSRNQWNLLDQDVLHWVTDALPAEKFLDILFEARMAIEPYASELAAEKATEQDIARIAEAYQAMASAPNAQCALEPDIRFHQAILDATHNDVISYIGRTLHNALAISISLTTHSEQVHELSLPRHKAVYLAIAERDPSKARTAARKLLQDSRLDF